MKRKRNVQQVKEYDKTPPKQTKEEEIGSLNLENKMELQISSLETRIKKMPEMFNKDLEEIKTSDNNE